MKNTFGTSVSLTVFGESHGEQIGAVLDGMAPGIPVDETYIRSKLAQRRPTGQISTARSEADPFSMVSGVYRGKTTGTPITVLIPNLNTQSADYDALCGKARPGHADYAAECKYHGFQDERGGGHFSGRITAGLVAAGSICRMALEQKGIFLGAHILSCGGVPDREFENYAADLAVLSDRTFAVLDEDAGAHMQQAILAARAAGDSVGGVLECVVIGMPSGVGEPWFDSVEGLISHAMFGIPGIKGVSFGEGFSFAKMRGSEANDPFRRTESGEIVTVTNHNGGVNGGITNGMPILFRCAVKPTPTIALPQQTVDFRRGENIVMEAKGRHDPAIVHRVRAVAEALCAVALCDMLAGRFGSDWLAAERNGIS